MRAPWRALRIHFGHRRSLDLDLFTADEAAFRAALASLPVIAAALGAGVEILTDAPAFRRVLLTGPDGQTLRVDLVLRHPDGRERLRHRPLPVAAAVADHTSASSEK